MEFNDIAKKWQKKWEKSKIFKSKIDEKKEKYMTIEMYPYPSSSSLHMGHARNYVIGDVHARFKRMNGFNVLYPMGYDSFGLPAENAAIKFKSHPKIFVEEAIEKFKNQQKSLGLSYDWDRMIMSHDPKYYKWDQWIFLKMMEKGLAYKKKSAVNWCPECKTVLANEQVHDGKCWRHSKTDVILKELDQWFFKTTKYSEELLTGLDDLDWSEEVKDMQRNWIGKSRGTLIDFKIKNSEKGLTVFTTRPDTFFGITYLVYAPEHPDVIDLVKGTEVELDVKEFVRKVSSQDRYSRTAAGKEKEGMFIGKYAVNPVTGEDIPIYIANFVLHEYGTGAIIAVPAHDQRDFEFAKKYKIPIKIVINPKGKRLNLKKMTKAFVDDGVMTNSKEFDGMGNREAIEKITEMLEKKKCGGFTTQYKLRDWLVSRQRFWGTPIPVVYCEKCGAVPVPEKDLPVKLPDDVKFTSAENPLLDCKEFLDVKCPKCSGKGRRETDTMDTFVNSSWYFLRYCDAKNSKAIFDSKKANYWMPVDCYIGGKEHACMHLIYFRFYTKFLRDLGLLKVSEPATKLFNQGMLHAGDGHVMSKSRGNVILPETISEKYGIDTGRFFLMFVAGPGKDMFWSDEGVEGSFKFMNKFYSLLGKVGKGDSKQVSKLHKTIRDVTKYIEEFKFNLACISLMEMVKYLDKQDKVGKDVLKGLVLLMAPFSPHVCEEMWSKLGEKEFVSLAAWPKFDETLIDEKGEFLEEFVESVKEDFENVKKLAKLDEVKEVKLIVSSAWKYDFVSKFKKKLEKTRHVGELIKGLATKEHGKDISKMVPMFVKNPSRVPKMVLSQSEELKALEGLELQGKVIVEKAEDSSEGKASSAMPGKVAIVLS